MVNIINHQETTAIPYESEVLLHTHQMAILKKTDDNSVVRTWISWNLSTLLQPLQKTAWKSFHHPAILL